MIDINIKVPALEKLLDYTASGIGAVAGSMLAPWRAKQEADSKLIETKSEADCLQLIASAQAEARSCIVPGGLGSGELEIDRDGITQRIAFQEMKRQRNIKSAVQDAATEIGDREVPDQEPNHDWTARFFEGVQDVSSEDVRKIWAKVLAGEVQKPGGTSLHTLSILKNMSQKEAEMFFGIIGCTINSFVDHESYMIAIGNAHPISNQEFRQIIPESFFSLQELGLIYSMLNINQEFNLNSQGQHPQMKGTTLILIEGEENQSIRLRQGCTLTSPGKELAAICETEPNLNYLSHFAKFLVQQKCTLKIVQPVLEYDGDNFVIDRKKLRIIKPAP